MVLSLNDKFKVFMTMKIKEMLLIGQSWKSL